MSDPNIQYLKVSLLSSINKLVREIDSLDQTIYAYNVELEKAQPLFSGRVLVKFSARDRIKIEDDFYCDKMPAPGRMLKKRDGEWIFVWIKSPNLEKLEDYRVGKGLEWDRPVVKLLRGLGQMLIKRQLLLAELKGFRTNLMHGVQSVSYLQNKKLNELLEISSQIKVDWSKDAKNIFEKYYG